MNRRMGACLYSEQSPDSATAAERLPLARHVLLGRQAACRDGEEDEGGDRAQCPHKTKSVVQYK